RPSSPFCGRKEKACYNFINLPAYHPLSFHNYVTRTGGGDLLSEYRREAVIRYIEDRIFIFLLVTLIFITGIIGGAVAVNGLREGQKLELAQYLHLFFQGFKQESRPAVDFVPAGRIVLSHLKTL